MQNLMLKGHYFLTYRDRLGRVRWRESVKNGILVPGIDHLLTVALNGGAQTSWGMGLIDTVGYAEIADTDVTGSHAGWSEYTGYSGNRPSWNGTIAVAGGLAANTSPCQFTFTADGAVRGVFLASGVTKNGVADVLFSTALFSTVRTVVAGATLTASYALRGAGGN